MHGATADVIGGAVAVVAGWILRAHWRQIIAPSVITQTSPRIVPITESATAENDVVFLSANGLDVHEQHTTADALVSVVQHANGNRYSLREHHGRRAIYRQVN